MIFFKNNKFSWNIIYPCWLISFQVFKRSVKFWSKNKQSSSAIPHLLFSFQYVNCKGLNFSNYSSVISILSTIFFLSCRGPFHTFIKTEMMSIYFILINSFVVPCSPSSYLSQSSVSFLIIVLLRISAISSLLWSFWTSLFYKNWFLFCFSCLL